MVCWQEPGLQRLAQPPGCFGDRIPVTCHPRKICMSHSCPLSISNMSIPIMITSRSCVRACVCVCVCLCVCVRCLIAVHPSADISRPSGTFNQPGVKHAEGQMRRELRSSGAEITLCCLFAWFCVATRRRPSEPQLVFLQFAISVVLHRL